VDVVGAPPGSGGGDDLAGGPADLEGVAVDDLLERAVARPVESTLADAPPELMRRAMEWCAVSLHDMVTAHRGRDRAGERARRDSSRWAWVMPALLLRRPPHMSAEEGARASTPELDAAAVYDLTLSAVLRRRLGLADAGKWRQLLEEYVAEVDAGAGRQHGVVRSAAVAPRADADRRYERCVQMVLGNAIARGKRELLSSERPERSDETAEEIARLACVEVDDDEVRATALEATQEAGVRPRRVTRRTLRRRMFSLRAGASPGPSGWRNAYIIRLLQLPGGIEAVLGFAHIIAEGVLGKEDALLWGAAVLEPVDCGPAPAAAEGERQSGVRGRKLRPIGLSEVLVKFSECCAIEEELARIKSVLEPAQLGAATPDGCAIAVRVLRGWCDDITEGRHDPDVVVAALDLENAFGRMRRSSALAAMRERVPGLYRMLAGQWRHGAVRAWQRVGGG